MDDAQETEVVRLIRQAIYDSSPLHLAYEPMAKHVVKVLAEHNFVITKRIPHEGKVR